MIIILPTLSLFVLFAVIVSGQICVEETLDCSNPVSTAFKLGNASCPCNDPTHAGVLKYVNGEVYVCLGSEWKTVQLLDNLMDYGTAENPGVSCKDIHDKAGQQLSDGVYWIRLPGKSNGSLFFFFLSFGAIKQGFTKLLHNKLTFI